MPVIQCLRNIIHSGAASYPIFIGFVSAQEILEVAEAPSFSQETSHQTIANNILTPPIRDWQRPLETERIDRIASTFNNTGQLMPNPVLLCENVTTNERVIKVRQQHVVNGVPTNVWEVEIPPQQAGTAKPLWILDGQHRINGLAISAQSGNAIPVVLLLNETVDAYNGPLVARLFAQVTTSAQKLDDLHNEWLTFAFHLDDYASDNPVHSEHRRAMEVVARLCDMPLLSASGPNNPFTNQVRFNVHRSVAPRPGGFAYSCIELKELVRRHYFSCSAPVGSHLGAAALAQQIGLSYLALMQVVTAPLDRTVFFGTHDEFGQRIIQDAYLVGVFSYLLHHPPPASVDIWLSILRGLQFNATNWNFRSWIRTLSGRAQSTSRQLALDVFASVFRQCALPTGPGNLADFLRGNNAKIVLTFSYLTATNRASRTGKQELEVTKGATLSAQINPRRHVKVTTQSQNIGRLTITDKNSPPGRVVAYSDPMRGGMILGSEHANPISLLISMEHYGGIESEADVEIGW